MSESPSPRADAAPDANAAALQRFATLTREALRQGHHGPIQLLHLASEPAAHYLAAPLQALAAQHWAGARQSLDIRPCSILISKAGRHAMPMV